MGSPPAPTNSCPICAHPGTFKNSNLKTNLNLNLNITHSGGGRVVGVKWHLMMGFSGSLYFFYYYIYFVKIVHDSQPLVE